MNVLNHDDLKELLQIDANHFVSLFMPTHRTGREQRQDPLRLKNLLKRAGEKLAEAGLSERDVEQIVEPAWALHLDESFWRHTADGLAVFCADGCFRCHRLPLRLPEQLVVNRQRFYLKPLLPLLHSNGRYYVLALNQDKAKLYEATRYSIHEIELPDIPRAPIDGGDETLQYHSHRAPTSGKGNTSEAIYHGQGGPDDRTKDDVAKFFHAVNRAVRSVLGNDRAPLVLACVGYLAPIYASANSYANLIRGKVPGSPDMWSPDELRDRAWQFVEPVFGEKQQAAIARLQRARGSDRASDDLDEVIAAAREGRVATLFVAADWKQPGDMASGNGSSNGAEGGETIEAERLDTAAAQTLAHGGEVFATPVESLPTDGQPVAALFRYPSPAAMASAAAETSRV